MQNDWRQLNQEEYLMNAKFTKSEYKNLQRNGIMTTVLSVGISSVKTMVTYTKVTVPQIKNIGYVPNVLRTSRINSTLFLNNLYNQPSKK